MNDMNTPGAAGDVAPSAPTDAQIAGVGQKLLTAVLESMLMTVTFGIGWIIWAAITSSEGQTPARKLLGLRVVDADTGKPVTLAKLFFMRGILGSIVAGIAYTLSFSILFFMPLWDKKNQSIVDKISNTVIVTV
jgi:uncharacterized RDD family membrane protein YckC